MPTSGLTSAAVPDAVRLFLDGLCSFDVDQFTATLSGNARLSVGSEVYAAGRHRVRQALVQVLGATYSLHCQPVVVWMKGGVAVIEADVVCERLDRARVSFPLTIVLMFSAHLITAIRLLTYEPEVMGSLRKMQTHRPR